MNLNTPPDDSAVGRTGEAFLRLLPKLGVHIQNLREFSPKHVRALMDHYLEEEEEVSTIKNNATVMRRLLVWINKVKAVDAVDQIMSEAQIGERTFVVTVSKTLRSKGQCRQELFAAARAADRIFGAQIKMCTLFGLRRKESTHLRPEESDEGTRLRVYRGTYEGGLVFDKASREDLEQLLAKTVGSHVFLTEMTDALRAQGDGLEVL